MSKKDIIFLIAVLIGCIVGGFLAKYIVDGLCLGLDLFEDGSFALSGCLPWQECFDGFARCYVP